MAQPITVGKRKRVAELTGLGLSREEVAGAVKIGDGSVARILADPTYRKIADDIKAERNSLAGTMASVVREMLTATDHKGEPIYGVQQKGAELYARFSDIVDAGLGDEGDDLLTGVVMRFPQPRE